MYDSVLPPSSNLPFLFLSFFCVDFLSRPVAGDAGLLAAQGQWRHGAAEFLHLPHRTLPLHVLGLRLALRHPAVQRSLPSAALHQPGQPLHPVTAGLLVRPPLP